MLWLLIKLAKVTASDQLGIELAEEATRRLVESGAGEAAARVAFHQTDLHAHPLHDATVVWYARSLTRPRSSRRSYSSACATSGRSEAQRAC